MTNASVTRICAQNGSSGVARNHAAAPIAAGAAVWGLVIGATEPLLRTIMHLASPEGYVGRVVGTAAYHRSAGELIPLAYAPALAST